jgi:uncharacterized membrane protein
MIGPAAEDEPRSARSSRWLKIGLITSLAINLLVVGTVGGSIWAFRQGEHGHGRGVNAHLIGFTSTLGWNRRYEIWRATREERRLLRTLRKEVRAARAEARSALMAQPFDKSKFAEAQGRVLAAEYKARAEAHKLFIAVADVLTPQERAAFARWEPKRRAERLRLRRERMESDAAAPPRQQQ